LVVEFETQARSPGRTVENGLRISSRERSLDRFQDPDDRGGAPVASEPRPRSASLPDELLTQRLPWIDARQSDPEHVTTRQ
jgi:hypothetical protein